MNPVTRSRSVYERIKAEQYKAGKMNVVTTPGSLRFEQSLSSVASLNQVSFNILTNDGGTANVTEKRLRYTDNFVITALGFFIMKAGTTTTATQAQIAAAQLHTFPNPIIFAKTGEAANLMAVYNGSFNITVNNYVFVDTYQTYDFYRVPAAQQGTFAATGGVAVGADGWDVQNYGMMPMEPTVKLLGNGKNQITVNLPIATDLTGTTSQNFIVCIVKGFNELNINAGNG